MLKKKFRVPIQSFPKNIKKRVGNDFFSIKLKENNLPFNRYGAIVGLKINKKASGRIKLKRIIFQTMKQANQNKSKKYDILIIPTPRVSEIKSTKEIKENISNLLTKI